MYIRPKSLTLLVAVMLLLSISSTLFSQEVAESRMRLLTATGVGEVRTTPDLLEVRLGVETEAATASQARQRNAERVSRVVSALRRLGIAEDSMQTSVYTIHPVRRYADTEPRTGEPPVVGYSVQNIITVRTRNLDLAPRIIDESVAAGANRVDSVVFTIDREREQRDRALKEAVRNAQRDAESMAGELRVRLVRVHSVVGGGSSIMPPPVFYRGGAMEAAASTPILPGEVTVSASVTVTYVIE